MAIGKVNAYATVEAPKADFGAVAQLNIDNLVKSAKEDEQLKAAKKAAEDKAKKERSDEFGDFVEFDASGVSLQDQYSNKEATELLPKWLENKELYKQTSDPKYLTEGKRILGYVKGVNKNTAVLKESVDRFAIAAGKDEIASKWSQEGMKRIKSLENGNIVFGRGNDGNGAVATYEDTPEGGKKLKLKEKYPDWLSILSNAPNAVKFTDELQRDKNLFEKNLTETQVNALRKEGTKAISGATKAAIEKLAESKMNDDRFLAVYLSEIGATTDSDFRTSGFDIKEKQKAIDAYTKQLISLYGVEKTVDVKQAPTPAKGDGGKTRTPLTFTTVTNADFYGNKDEQGNNLDNYAINAKSGVLSGISGTDPKSAKYIIPSFEKWSAKNKEGVSKPTGEIMTDYVVDKLLYDSKGRPTVSGNYIDVKSTTYKAALLDATQRLMKQREELKSGETDSEIKAKAAEELSLNSEAYGIKRVNHVQQIGKVEEQDLIAYLIANKGKINGIKIKDVSSVKRAMGYNSTVATESKYSKYNPKK